MSSVMPVKVGEETFNVVQAPADKQKKLLSLIGAKIALNSAVSGVTKIDTDLLFGALLTLPEDEFDVIAGIVLYQTVKKDGTAIVDIGDFQNSITDYYQLVAKAIEVNLGDFFTYLDSVNKKTKTDQKSA
jgi:hypothetical protein